MKCLCDIFLFARFLILHTRCLVPFPRDMGFFRFPVAQWVRSSAVIRLCVAVQEPQGGEESDVMLCFWVVGVSVFGA